MKFIIQLILIVGTGVLYSQETTPSPWELRPNTEIFKVVEEMPKFAGCNEIEGSEKEKMDCTLKRLNAYIIENLNYPDEARENQTEGMAVVQFIVWNDGSIKDISIVRDPGDGCGEATKDLVLTMNDLGLKWSPGIQRGRPVNVLYTLPVEFRLDGVKIADYKKTKKIRKRRKRN